MPADDRDPKFERALAHHLRGDAAAACPDAETLAAYHERSLSLEEMAHWKQHISGCAACQETLALLETTEEELAEVSKETPIPVMQAAAQPPTTMRSHAVGKEEARGEEAPAPTSTPVAITRRRRPPLLRWAIPLGVAAAAALVWIGIHEQRVLTRQAESVQTAQNPASSAPLQMAQNQPVPAPEPEQRLNDALRTEQPPVDRNDRQAQLAEESSGKRAESANGKSKRETPAAPPAKPEVSAKDRELTKKEPSGRGAGSIANKATPAPAPALPRDQVETKAPVSMSESVEVSAATPPVATGSFQAGVGVGGAAGGTAGDVKSAPAQEVDSIAAARAGKEKARNKQQGANDLNTTTNAMMMKPGVTTQSVEISSAGPPLILTPDPKVWWKLDPAGTLQLTTNGGKTWKPVSVGASALLTAGSAPSSKVCWFAGRAGTLVLTTDRGAHWKTLTTPITVDLGEVRATDAKHATIWDAARQQSFETSDGGVTWKQTAP